MTTANGPDAVNARTIAGAVVAWKYLKHKEDEE